MAEVTATMRTIDLRGAAGLRSDAVAGPLTWRALLEFDVVGG